VSTAPPGGQPPAQGSPGRSEKPAAGRAAVLVVAAVVLGVVLLNAGNHQSSGSAATPTTTTTLPASSTTTTHAASGSRSTTTVPRSSVHVQVANGTQKGSIAADYTQELQAQGWNMLAAEDTTTAVNASTVYYAAGQQAAAAEIASFLALPPSSVTQITSAVPVPSIAGVDVLVVAGPDLAAKAPATSTT